MKKEDWKFIRAIKVINNEVILARVKSLYGVNGEININIPKALKTIAPVYRFKKYS